MDANQSLQALREGNARYVSGRGRKYDMAARRAELVAGQHPFVSVLTCSDSRVVPEFIFDVMPGDMFTIITAGNVADHIGLGSIEYGCKHLHTPLLVVMGHSGCGAVKATCDCRGVCDEGHIKHIVEVVNEAASKREYELDKSIIHNVECEIARIRKKSQIVRTLEGEKKLVVVGAFYSLETGKVEFI